MLNRSVSQQRSMAPSGGTFRTVCSSTGTAELRSSTSSREHACPVLPVAEVLAWSCEAIAGRGWCYEVQLLANVRFFAAYRRPTTSSSTARVIRSSRTPR